VQRAEDLENGVCGSTTELCGCSPRSMLPGGTSGKRLKQSGLASQLKRHIDYEPQPNGRLTQWQILFRWLPRLLEALILQTA
jgi:hypothetical protein